MPIYEYACQDCQHNVELLIRSDEKPACPHCQSVCLQRKLSLFAAPASGAGNKKSATEFPAGGCGRPQCGTLGCQGIG